MQGVLVGVVSIMADESASNGVAASACGIAKGGDSCPDPFVSTPTTYE